MADKQIFSATSQAGDFSEALRGAIDTATRELNTNYFAWKLETVSGSVGGFVGANDVSVSISTGESRAGFVGEKAEERRCGDWHAWHDRMPGKRATLHVVGRCVFPTGGYSVTLRPVSPQGFNPSIYILEKIVESPKPGDVVTQKITTVNIHYREETNAVYTTVHIVPDNTLIDVQEVS